MSYTVAEIIEDIGIKIGERRFSEVGGAVVILRAMNRVYKAMNRQFKPIQRDYYVNYQNADQVISYNNQTGEFTKGDTITGATSGTTAVITEIFDNGTQGRLFLSSVSGDFTVGEQITDTSTGVADVLEANELAGSVDLPADFILLFRLQPHKTYRSKEVFSFDESGTYSIYDNKFYFADAEKDTEFVLNYYSQGRTLVETVADVLTEVDEPEYPEDLKQILLYATVMELSQSHDTAQSDFAKLLELQKQLKRLKHFVQVADPIKTGPHSRLSARAADPYETSRQEFI